MNSSQKKHVVIYCKVNGSEPFTKWLNSLRDPATRRRILKRLLRVENGHYGDFKQLGEGINELRFFFGAGYRIYFGEDGDKIVVLLCGGDKSSQTKNIKQARVYWQEYLHNANI